MLWRSMGGQSNIMVNLVIGIHHAQQQTRNVTPKELSNCKTGRQVHVDALRDIGLDLSAGGPMKFKLQVNL